MVKTSCGRGLLESRYRGTSNVQRCSFLLHPRSPFACRQGFETHLFCTGRPGRFVILCIWLVLFGVLHAKSREWLEEEELEPFGVGVGVGGG
jgi:hypothetical protein